MPFGRAPDFPSRSEQAGALRRLLSALVAAHRGSILHLDVKPSNVLRDGAEGYVLTDFGVSQATRIQRGAGQRWIRRIKF